MKSKLQIATPLVSVDWLLQNIDAINLIIFDATLKKITDTHTSIVSKEQLKGARFFDIKNVFSDQNSNFPNTILSSKEFEKQAQNIGVNKDSAIVVYDNLGIYSSPRVWWLFKSMGHNNVAVLNGGLPVWKERNLPTEAPKIYNGVLGNFKSNYDEEFIYDYQAVFNTIENSSEQVVDARSVGRFNATELEPRKEIRSGHIPTSKNLPYTAVLDGFVMKSKDELTTLFNKVCKEEVKVVFSCGSGITACILALAAEIIGKKKIAIYDGSWTEWGSKHELPIEK